MGVIGSLRCATACIIGVGFGWCASACGDANVFVCGTDQQCGADGQCESTGFCSFPDGTCASGRRYGEHSGGLAGECVDAQPMTGTDEGGPASTSSSTDANPITEGSESTGPQISGSDGTTGEPTDTSTSAESSGSPGPTSTGTPIERVVDGLVVLYTFDEGMGEIVQDVSGVEPPIDLTVMGDGYEWTDDGLVKSNLDGILLAEGSATKILEACQATNEITLEAWVTPSDPFPQPAPARVLTYSLDSQNRNFTLGQTDGLEPSGFAPAWVVRLRTSTGNANGYPELIWLTEVALEPTHLAFVHDADGNEALYVNTVVQAIGKRPGTFENWDPDTATYKFAIGNELMLERSWNGTFHLAAIYDRALSQDEVQQNYDAGY